MRRALFHQQWTVLVRHRGRQDRANVEVHSPRGWKLYRTPPRPALRNRVLRWTSHRERRGNIYAAAVSPDPKGRYIAVGGLGIRNSQFAVLDRYSGEIRNAVPYLTADSQGWAIVSIWSVAFSPRVTRWPAEPAGGQSGSGIGKTAGKPVHLGQHETRGPGLDYNKSVCWLMRMIILSVPMRREASMARIPVSRAKVGAKILAFSDHDQPEMLIRCFAMSADGKWLAAALEGNRVEIRSLGGGRDRRTSIEPRNYPSAIGFDPTGESSPSRYPCRRYEGPFYKELSHRVVVYDVSPADPSRPSVPELPGRNPGIPSGWNYLAAAGGNNHDVNVYGLANPGGPLGRAMAGPGQCIWSVLISKDGRYLGFQTERQPNPDHPNQRAQVRGKSLIWNADCSPRTRHLDPMLEKSADGWEVKFSANGTAGRPMVRPEPGGRSCPFRGRESSMSSRAATPFYPRRSSRPDSLSVICTAQRLSSRRKAPCGRESDRPRQRSYRHGTVRGWQAPDHGVARSDDRGMEPGRLAQPSPTGGQFFRQGGKLWVGTLDQGSPIWEAGLSTGDEVVLLVVERKIIYNRSGKYGKDSGLPGSGTL